MSWPSSRGRPRYVRAVHASLTNRRLTRKTTACPGGVGGAPGPRQGRRGGRMDGGRGAPVVVWVPGRHPELGAAQGLGAMTTAGPPGRSRGCPVSAFCTASPSTGSGATTVRRARAGQRRRSTTERRARRSRARDPLVALAVHLFDGVEPLLKLAKLGADVGHLCASVDRPAPQAHITVSRPAASATRRAPLPLTS